MEFRLPALGEGIDSATVVDVLVKPGDAVAAGQNVVAVETDKAAIEVPAEVAGTVEQVLVKPGDKVPVGAPILKLAAAGAPSRTARSRLRPSGRPAQGPSRNSPPRPPPARVGRRRRRSSSSSPLLARESTRPPSSPCWSSRATR